MAVRQQPGRKSPGKRNPFRRRPSAPTSPFQPQSEKITISGVQVITLRAINTDARDPKNIIKAVGEELRSNIASSRHGDDVFATNEGAQKTREVLVVRATDVTDPTTFQAPVFEVTIEEKLKPTSLAYVPRPISENPLPSQKHFGTLIITDNN